MTEALAAAEAPPRRPRGRPRKPPEALDEGNRRQKLLRVAARLFRRKGFDATTTRDIAAAAGMRSGSPFYHFESKAALLCAVVRFQTISLRNCFGPKIASRMTFR